MTLSKMPFKQNCHLDKRESEYFLAILAKKEIMSEGRIEDRYFIMWLLRWGNWGRLPCWRTEGGFFVLVVFQLLQKLGQAAN